MSALPNNGMQRTALRAAADAEALARLVWRIGQQIQQLRAGM
jgi:hypothetical protein